MGLSRPSAALLTLLVLVGSLVPGAAGGVESGAGADGLPRVLVAGIPFRIHSEQPLSHLERSLPDLVASRLAASGRVEVVDKVLVAESALGHATGELSDSALRRHAAELGADYVVTGSLTELAGRFSLDVRLVPLAGGEPAAFALTADSEEELLDRINELADRILARVARARPAVVAEVAIEGAGPLEAELRALLGTQPGTPYDSARVRSDLGRLRARPDLASATVETDREGDEVRVRFRVVRSEALLGRDEGEAPGEVVAEVRVEGNRRIERDAILARVGTRPGEPYRPGQIARDVKEIHALGFFKDIRVSSERTPKGRVVTFHVEENPVVRRISIEGNDSISAEKIRDALTLTTGSTLDIPLLLENKVRIESLYRAEGFYLAEAGYEIEPLAGDSVGVHFRITEGEKLRLAEIRFEGNEALSDDELRRGLKTKPWRLWSWVTRYLDNSGTYAEPVFLQDLRTIEEKYMNRGYLQVQIGEPRVIPEEDGLVVVVDIEEGEQFFVGKLDVEGDATVDREALAERIELEEGGVFDRSALTADVETLTRYYTDRGFYFASVEPRTSLDPASRKVDVTFEVEKGPLYFVRDIRFEGNTTTVDSVLRREMMLVEGELYSQRAVQRSNRRIQNLGFFDEVNFEPQPTDSPGQLDLDVKVVERSTGSLSFGAGFSSQDRFVLNAALSQSNLFGRGYAVNLSADVGGRTSRYLFSFADPYLFDTDLSLRGSLFSTAVEFEDFDQEQQGVDILFGHPLNEANNARGFLRYTFARRKVLDDTGVNAAGVIFRQILSGEESTSLVGLSFRSDFTDDPISPTRGWAFNGGIELAGLGGFSRFFRAESTVARFWPAPDWFPIFPGRSTFAAIARIGWTLPLNDISDFDIPSQFIGDQPFEDFRNVQWINFIDEDVKLPLTERYFLGGLGQFQLRGYKARSVGPRRPILKRTGAFGLGNSFTTVGREGALLVDENGNPDGIAFVCLDVPGSVFNRQGDLDGRCNDITDKDIDDFEDLDETDVIGGSKFIALNFEYRFPISETLGLAGIVFLDMGNAFAEEENLFDVTNWRYGTGVGVQWFSPFGPLMAVWGIPLNRLEVEDSNVFEFSMGGQTF